jgi:hypothetical protein
LHEPKFGVKWKAHRNPKTPWLLLGEDVRDGVKGQTRRTR